MELKKIKIFLEKTVMFIGGGVIQKGNTILYSKKVEIIDLESAAECIPSHLEIPIGMCFNPFDIH